jgi:hypothetical protein
LEAKKKKDAADNNEEVHVHPNFMEPEKEC